MNAPVNFGRARMKDGIDRSGATAGAGRICAAEMGFDSPIIDVSPTGNELAKFVVKKKFPWVKAALGVTAAIGLVTTAVGVTHNQDSSVAQIATKNAVAAALSHQQPTVNQAAIDAARQQAASIAFAQGQAQANTDAGKLQQANIQLQQDNANLRADDANVRGQLTMLMTIRKANYDACLRARDIVVNNRSVLWGAYSSHDAANITCTL